MNLNGGSEIAFCFPTSFLTRGSEMRFGNTSLIQWFQVQIEVRKLSLHLFLNLKIGGRGGSETTSLPIGGSFISVPNLLGWI